MKKILVASDFSPRSIDAVQQAHDLAVHDDARLVLLWVQEPQEAVEGEFGMPPPPALPSDDEILARLQALLPAGSPVGVEFVIARGVPAEQIVRVASEMRCDCIVMGAHEDRGWLANLFHTSVVDQVKQSAPCPVIQVSGGTAALA